MSDDENPHKKLRSKSPPASEESSAPYPTIVSTIKSQTTSSIEGNEKPDETNDATSSISSTGTVPPVPIPRTSPPPPPPFPLLIPPINGTTPGMMAPISILPPPPNTMPPLVPPNALMMEVDKVNRELFVGNTAPGTSEQLLLQFLNGAMQRTNLCAPDHKPIIHCRMNTKFAFVECATVVDATNALNLNGIPFMGISLRVSRPSRYTGPDTPHKSWQELTGQLLPDNATPLSESSSVDDKLNRELFVGNTTPEMTETSLADFLSKAMEQVGLTAMPGNPVTACRLSGKFAFVELRSAEETSNALNLNNIPYMGVQLRVGRPSKYVGPETPHGNWEDILAKYISGELKLSSDETILSTTSHPPSSQTPTKIIVLRNMLTQDDLKSDDDYEKTLQDTEKECSRFGASLQNVIIPRSGAGASNMFLQYETVDDAVRAMKALSARTFDGEKVDAAYFDEDKFWKQDYSS